jgi:hypothetical protein
VVNGGFAARGLPGQPSFDQTKGWGPFQQAPLTPEFKRKSSWKRAMADQIDGGLGNYSTARCLPGGMPRMTVAFEPREYIITPHTTYILIGENDHYRRIFTDGRSWPSEIEPTFAGYSIGKWIDEDGERPLRRARSRDARSFQESTCLRRRWTSAFTINPSSGNAFYFLSADGLLMPTRKDQPPPDLAIFQTVTEIAAVARILTCKQTWRTDSLGQTSHYSTNERMQGSIV